MKTAKPLITFLLVLPIVLWGCSKQEKIDPVSDYEITAIEQDFSAHWLRSDLLVLKSSVSQAYLLASEDGKLDDGEVASSRFPLKAIDQPEWLLEHYPHLSEFYAFEVTIEDEKIKSLLTQQLAVLQIDKKNLPVALSYVQHYGIIDQLFTGGDNDADEFTKLGAWPKENGTDFSLWAPTAIDVKVKLFNQDKIALDNSELALEKDSTTGIWSGASNLASHGTFYLYEISVYHPSTKAIEVVTVTDPYSLSLSTNSLFSQVANLNEGDTQPEGWSEHSVPEVLNPEANIFYEMHIRDFSASDTNLSDASYAGKYKAFSESDSFGALHLKALGEAGLNTLHLLPTYDIGTVNEDPERTIFPSDNLQKICALKPDFSLCKSNISADLTLQTVLQSYDPMGSDAQNLIEQLRELDPYNWGYDPFHYTVPEGSYALEPDGFSRLREFREMVQSIHNKGFRVIMDVVYNHTYQAGLGNKSVLDKIVPNYYHRLNPITGGIEQSTCCDNTATENRMMAKLMIDSLVVWARDYKIDGFRFDLMGHQPKAAMLEAREAVRAVDADTYFYGEGWNFGEVANNAQFVQASQQELAGTEIGTFTDRLRDAVRGGSSFVSRDAIRLGQGIGNGLLLAPNELQSEENNAAMLAEYFLSMDQIRIGLAANLANFPLRNATGEQVTGKDIDYGGGPTGYAHDPADTINYVSKHDNQTLWDNHQYRIASEISTDDRVRMQVLSLAYPLMAQGIPFLHMGSELLRSKSFLRDSYDYADWFNRVDFSKQTNNYHVGLPPEVKDGDNWAIISRIITANEGRDQVKPANIEATSDRFIDLLAIRTSSPLFSLTSAEQVIERVRFHNTGPEQQPGLIVMSIADLKDEKDLDKDVNNIIVLFNNSLESVQFAYPGAAGYRLHDRLQNGADTVVKGSISNEQGFQIPPLTVAVFVN